MRDINMETVERGLPSTALTFERTNALLEIGLPPIVIATATGVSASGLRNWKLGTAEPRPVAALRLDSLRFAAFSLLERGMEPHRVQYWLRSINTDTEPPCYRPTELIAADEPEKVFALIEKSFPKED